MAEQAKPRVLVVEDEAALRRVLELRLLSQGFLVQTAGNGREALDAASLFSPDIVLSDIFMPDLSGIDLMRLLQEGSPGLPVVLMTSIGTIDMAVEAVLNGASNFLTKPVDIQRLDSVLRAALERPSPKADGRPKPSVGAPAVDGGPALREGQEPADAFDDFIGSGKAMRGVFDLIRAVAPKLVSVLITGESGTGKELVSRTIHRLSPCRTGPFVAVNAAAIPKDLLESEIFGHEKGAFTGAASSRAGCFELADGGTLLLDELAEMPLNLQPKLLRVLEDGRVRRVGGTREIQTEVRVVASTNRSPREAIQEGLLREDLYYRLNVFGIDLPPLRNRREDIELLATKFLERFNSKHETGVKGFGKDVMAALEAYSWPGNVRQLRNVVERAVILSSDAQLVPLEALPAEVQRNEPLDAPRVELPTGITAAEAERHLILRTLDRTGNNKAEAARQLGLDVKTIRNKLKSYGLS